MRKTISSACTRLPPDYTRPTLLSDEARQITKMTVTISTPPISTAIASTGRNSTRLAVDPLFAAVDRSVTDRDSRDRVGLADVAGARWQRRCGSRRQVVDSGPCYADWSKLLSRPRGERY
jgi:hypothetical protein